jgi:hypothetical protein
MTGNPEVVPGKIGNLEASTDFGGKKSCALGAPTGMKIGEPA